MFEADIKLDAQAPYALQLRLTPQILGALREAQRQGQQPTIQVHQAPEASELRVGGRQYRFQTTPAELCSIISVPTGDSGEPEAAETVAGVRLKLALARTAEGGEGPVATFAQAAKPRAVLLQPGAAAQPRKAPRPRSPEQPTQASGHAGQQAAEQGAHALQPVLAGEGAMAAGAAELARTLDVSRSPAAVCVVSQRVLAAASKGGLRLALVALLSERPQNRRALASSLAAVEAAVQGFHVPAGREDLERAIKAVASYRPPGVYALTPGSQKELEGLPAAGGREGVGPVAGDKRRLPAPSSPSGGTVSEPRSGRAGSKPPGSQSSRGSGNSDESWIVEHAARQPRAVPPISSREMYCTLEEEFGRKFEDYFHLHQLLASNRSDFEALDAAVAAAATEEERTRRLAEIEKLWRRRSERAKRWDVAFQVLHAELTSIRARMSEYVVQLEGQKAPAEAMEVI